MDGGGGGGNDGGAAGGIEGGGLGCVEDPAVCGGGSCGGRGQMWMPRWLVATIWSAAWCTARSVTRTPCHVCSTSPLEAAMRWIRLSPPADGREMACVGDGREMACMGGGSEIACTGREEGGACMGGCMHGRWQ